MKEINQKKKGKFKTLDNKRTITNERIVGTSL